MRSRNPSTGLDLYTRCAQRSSAPVIAEYSTSFGMATRLFDARTRTHVRNIYALVRIADEVVDGCAAEAGLSAHAQRRALDDLESATDTALAIGYSTNPIVHAFAHTARRCGIDASLTAPFFASMRRDLAPVGYGVEELSSYVYGSAEVVGLMCVRAFLVGHDVSEERSRALEEGARRLGAAFQKINFLRDLCDDWDRLGRSYLSATTPVALREADKERIVDDIAADLNAAAAVIPDLPWRCRIAVTAAHGLFRSLAVRLRDTPVQTLLRTRVRIPAVRKAGILLSAALGGAPRRMR